ncbi:putative immunity protein [Methylobacterium sp. WL19]|uniref:putative immunity protein n=1 Tax=Methylobacterium sp. WL19 TaxID=2603896 RepID=UPI0011CA3C71|nr:hypothetical protein [Methylobacterium sp. WL19]TXN29119.1 hypothetical protein FV220_07530 [Methylobacterium sp. WL19]
MTDHAALAEWAAACAKRVQPIFELEGTNDARPRAAIAALHSWLGGELSMPEVRKFAFAAHAAARDVSGPAATAAARAAGHAAAVAHVPTHARHAAAYALKAVALSAGDIKAEAAWQRDRLAEHLQLEHCPGKGNE